MAETKNTYDTQQIFGAKSFPPLSFGPIQQKNFSFLKTFIANLRTKHSMQNRLLRAIFVDLR
jgi:hypothetical protein